MCIRDRFNIFQLLESMGITDNLLCLIRAKWLNSFDFLISSRVIGDDNLSLNLTVTATKRPDLSVLSRYASLITSTIQTISFPIFD